MGRSRKPLNALQRSGVSIYRSTNHVFMKLINSVQSCCIGKSGVKHSVSLSSATNASEQNMIDVFCSSSRWSLGLLLVLCEVMLVKFNRKSQAGFHIGSTVHVYVCACMQMCACIRMFARCTKGGVHGNLKATACMGFLSKIEFL